MEILIPVLLLLGAALLCAVLLTVASVCFAVPTDQKQTDIRDCLPGANCGACGYSGCDGYAAALAAGEVDKTNLCIPGGDNTAQQIAAILGVEAEDVVEQVAYVACNGSCGLPQDRKYVYDGIPTCKGANMAYAGDEPCMYACLGYGDCLRACPQNAICIENGVAHVDARRCIGCGICERTCPNHIIRLVKDITRVVVKCSNHDKGAVALKACNNSCIGCGKCAKICPGGAITVENNLAVIDHGKCTSCGLCRTVCPRGCIHEGNFICGAHFVEQGKA